MMQAIRRFGIKNAIVSSNWIADMDPERCKGCARCADVCPAGAVTMVAAPGFNKKNQRAERDAEICLGCGVCYSECKNGALAMIPRERRVYTPETMFDRYVAMAIERGKLAELIFEEPDGFGHLMMARVLSALEHTPPFKAAMAIQPLKSLFLSRIVAAAKG
jgi:ferredoxin